MQFQVHLFYKNFFNRVYKAWQVLPRVYIQGVRRFLWLKITQPTENQRKPNEYTPIYTLLNTCTQYVQTNQNLSKITSTPPPPLLKALVISLLLACLWVLSIHRSSIKFAINQKNDYVLISIKSKTKKRLKNAWQDVGRNVKIDCLGEVIQISN